MNAFRAFLALIFSTVVIYTMVVVSNHGLNLFPIFFGDIGELAWPGQFNMDFMGFLALSGFWLAWRNHFSAFGIGLGILGFFGGVPVLTAYLLYTSFAVDGDVKVLLLGPERVSQ